MIIEMRNIARVYQKGSVNILALQQINLAIAEGEFIAIMGPSGSGKSTLLHVLGCLDRPSKGIYQLDGIEAANLSDPHLSLIRNQKIGFVFQSFHLLPQHTVLQNIEAPLLYTHQGGDLLETYPYQKGDERLQRVREIAGQVGLEQRLYHRPSELSGGEMQRVAIARALVAKPRVILADEPTGNLDSRTGQEIMHILQTLHEQGHTVIVVTHENSVAAYAERTIHLKDGKIEREERVGRRQKAEGSKQKAVDSKQGVGGRGQEKKHDLPTAHRLLPNAFWLLPAVSDTAVKGVLLHKLRSFLSVLGIVFGIGAIIAMLAIGSGAKQEILEQIELLGTTNISVKAIVPSEEQIMRGREQLSQGVTHEDADRISQVSPFIEAIAAIRTIPLTLQYGQQMAQAEVVGTTPEYQHTGNLHIRDGRFVTVADLREMRRVCVLGDEIRQALFAFRNPLGQMIKIRHDWFRIVGILENKRFDHKSNALLQMKNVNRQVYIPLSTSSVFIPPHESERIQEISIRVKKPEYVDEVARLIRNVLIRVHHGADDYDVIVPRELLKQSQQTQEVFNIVMGSIAGISLLVGGIGIMNIMLATVSERTREIGIRRAIGASRYNILLQFLIETLVLTLVGGCLGIGMGIGGAYLISYFAGWRTVISLQTILIAFSISALVGLVFGLYPASQGANMDPIAALRYE